MSSVNFVVEDLATWERWHVLAFLSVIVVGFELLNFLVSHAFASFNRIPMKAKHLEVLEIKVRASHTSPPFPRVGSRSTRLLALPLHCCSTKQLAASYYASHANLFPSNTLPRAWNAVTLAVDSVFPSLLRTSRSLCSTAY